MQDRLDEVRNLLQRYFDSINCEAFGRFRADFSFGKMLRSKLLLSIAPDSPSTPKICAIIELIHFASLLHDDVIDSANLRRGKQSINAKYGDKNAIMLGDILYSKAFYEIACEDVNLAQIISNAVFELSLGELDDVFLSEDINLDSQKYITMITRKTAALIEASVICGGILKFNLSQKNNIQNAQIKKYSTCGRNLGIAFQIIDDLLDITQEDFTLGKESFSDFKDGKTTLPYIYLYNALNENDKTTLKSYFKKPLDLAQKGWIRAKMIECNIITAIQNLAKDYGLKALSALDLNDSRDKNLQKIITDMIDREF